MRLGRPAVGWVLFGLAIIGIGMATLTPLPSQAQQSAATPLWCLACGEAGTADFSLNILLFLPLGAAVSVLRRTPVQAVAVAAVASFAVEAVQFLVVTGRDATAGDLLANAIGGWLGHQVVARWAAVVWPSGAQAKRYLLGWTVLVAAVMGVSDLGLRPRLPATPWFGQWAFYGPEDGWLRGTVEAAWLGDQPLAHGLLRDGEARRLTLRGQPLRLAAAVQVEATSDVPSRVLAVGSQQERFLSLGVTPGAARFRAPMRAHDLGLRNPTFQLPGLEPLGAGHRLELEGVLGPGWVQVSSRGPARDHAAKARLGWWDGWMLLVPFDIPLGWPLSLGRVAWMIGLLGPLGWWGWRALSSLPSGPKRVEGVGEMG